ncbi:unnamed protein product [Symbiodinium sp. CCMP2592]|nr:unnamed protein product [Symbiodinium sp. CCMP2592]
MAPVELWISAERTTLELPDVNVETLREALAKEHGIPAHCQLLSSDGRPFLESKGPLPADPLHVQDLGRLRPKRSDGKLAEVQRVEKTEERGIALQQLKALLAFVQATAAEEKPRLHLCGQSLWLEELLPWKGMDGMLAISFNPQPKRSRRKTLNGFYKIRCSQTPSENQTLFPDGQRLTISKSRLRSKRCVPIPHS